MSERNLTRKALPAWLEHIPYEDEEADQPSEQDQTPEQLGAPPPRRSDWDEFLAEWERGMARLNDPRLQAKRRARLKKEG